MSSDGTAGTNRLVAVVAGVLVVAVIVMFLRATLDWEEVRENSSRIIVALIGVGGTLITALSGVWLWSRQEVNRQNERLAAEQAERVKAQQAEQAFRLRLAAALRAEISASIDRLTLQFKDEAVRKALPVMAANIDAVPDESKDHGMPRSVGLEENAIFNSHQSEVLELRNDQLVRALVKYYQCDAYVARYLNAMTQGLFADISKARKKGATVNYYILGQSAYHAGLCARTLLDAHTATLAGKSTELPPEMSEEEIKARMSDEDRRILDTLAPDTETSRRENYRKIMGLEDK